MYVHKPVALSIRITLAFSLWCYGRLAKWCFASHIHLVCGVVFNLQEKLFCWNWLTKLKLDYHLSLQLKWHIRCSCVLYPISKNYFQFMQDFLVYASLRTVRVIFQQVIICQPDSNSRWRQNTFLFLFMLNFRFRTLCILVINIIVLFFTPMNAEIPVSILSGSLLFFVCMNCSILTFYISSKTMLTCAEYISACS